MPTRINVSRSAIVPVLSGATGIGASPLYFCKDSVQKREGEPGGFLFGLFNVVGVFTGLTVNVEFSPGIGTGEYWETVATWSPLAQPLLVTPCSESGFYRVNVTQFTGGTSLDVWATVANGTASSVTTSASDVSIFDSSGNALDSNGSGALNVAVVSGGGSNASVGANNGTAPSSSTQVGTLDAGGKLQAVSATNPVPVTVGAGSYVPALNATNQILVASGPTLIIASNASRQGVLITNPSATVMVYIGISTVTTTDGAILGPGQSITIPVTSEIYGVVATGTQVVSYIEVV
jgi:hypothetical protein